MVYSALKGRIGNNLFQIAAGLSLAKRNNTDFAAFIQNIILPQPDNCLLSNYLEQFSDNILRNVKVLNKLPEDSLKYVEPDACYSYIEYRKNILLDGYFQSEKYFDKELVRKTFSIDVETQAYISSKYSQILSQDVTAINIRRGDFKSLPGYHPVCSLKYFRSAINYIGRDKLFVVISDDINWCRKKFKGDNYYFIENEKPIVDLYLQSLCKNNIISNSSFSWWGAWLNSNPDKVVISPSENWMGKYHPTQNTSDLIPEDWIKLPNPLEFVIRIKLIGMDLIRFLVFIKKSLKRQIERLHG